MPPCRAAPRNGGDSSDRRAATLAHAQMTSQAYSSYFNNYLSLCAMLVYGSFPGGTVVNGTNGTWTLVPGVTPASTAAAASGPNLASYAPVQYSSTCVNYFYNSLVTQWTTPAALAAAVQAFQGYPCPTSSSYYFCTSGSGDPLPWLQVDLLYVASVTAVQLWRRIDQYGYMTPLAIVVTNTTLTTGASNALQPGATTPCYTTSGASWSNSITVPCVGVGRYVYIQMTNTQLSLFGNYITMCAILVFGSFPGGTVIANSTFVPGVTPAATALAARGANLAAYVPVQSSTIYPGLDINSLASTTAWANASVVNAGLAHPSTCPGGFASNNWFGTYPNVGDTQPWLQVDLLYVATITAVQLWRRLDTPQFLSPLVIVVTNTTLTPGNSAALQAGATKPCFTMSGLLTGVNVTVPCSGVGRYVYVQMTNTATTPFGSYLAVCGILVFGSFPGGTVIANSTFIPAVLPATTAVAASGANLAAYAPVQFSSTANAAPYSTFATQWPTSAALNAALVSLNACPSTGVYFQTNGDAMPWLQVDLLYVASITAVQLWRRSNTLMYLSPLIIVVTNTTLTPGVGTALLPGSATPCFTFSGAMPLMNLTAPCVGVGRYVYVQMTNTATALYGNVLSLCAVLVYGSFPGGTTIANGTLFVPAVTPASTELATAGPNLAAYAPVQSSTYQNSMQYVVSATQWANSSVLTDALALNPSTCPGSGYYFASSGGADTKPWLQVDLLYVASITAVQLWARTDSSSYYAYFMTPLVIVVTNTTLTPGASTALQSGATTPCFTYSGVVGGTSPYITVPCVGVGRYVYVQMTSTAAVSYQVNTYLSFCAILVYGSFPGGTVIANSTFVPAVTPASTALAASGPNVAYNAPAVASTLGGWSVNPNLFGPTQARLRPPLRSVRAGADGAPRARARSGQARWR